ncbi:MAG: archease [Terriglobia bacterium]
MPHPPYEILEHTADVGLKAYGGTLPELFVNAARGMIALALDPPVPPVPSGVEGSEVEPQKVRPAQCRPLAARGEDREELLVHFLSEILYALDAEGWQFSEFRIQTLEPTHIEAEGWGEQSERSAHRRVAVKAVTYHQVSVAQTAGGWEAVVYFDI